MSSAVGGGANFGIYSMLSDARTQLATGNLDENLQKRGFSWGQMLNSGVHGVMLGSATGGFSAYYGNLGNEFVRAAGSTTEKFFRRADTVLTSTVLEGTIFSIPEWISGERNGLDVWTDNLMMMAGFKGSHMLKSAPRVVRELRPGGAKSAETLTVSERIAANEDLRRRVNRVLDGNPELYFTKEEREELKLYGYGSLSDIFAKRGDGEREPHLDLNADKKAWRREPRELAGISELRDCGGRGSEAA